MPDRLLDAASRFTHILRECETPHAILQAVHEIVGPYDLKAYCCYHVPITVRRGKREPFSAFRHTSLPLEFWAALWEHYNKRGPSFIARHAWRVRRDFTMIEAMKRIKPTNEELSIVALFHRFGIADVLYVAPFDWFFFVFWSRQPIKLASPIRAALRELAAAAARGIEGMADTMSEEPEIILTPMERKVCRLWVMNGTSHLSSPQEIAQQLQRSSTTVRTHINRVKQKLGVHSIDEAAVELVRRFVVLGWVGMAVF